jgi:hypothetical protein
MHSRSLTAVVLCMAVQAAYAQCADPAAAQPPHKVAELKNPAVTSTPAQTGAHPGPGLIKTATAGVRDDAVPSREATPASQDQHEHPRRGGTAMLLAALALMSGIALRRYGAPRP